LAQDDLYNSIRPHDDQELEQRHQQQDEEEKEPMFEADRKKRVRGVMVISACIAIQNVPEEKGSTDAVNC
jgi:hypothetical protein